MNPQTPNQPPAPQMPAPAAPNPPMPPQPSQMAQAPVTPTNQPPMPTQAPITAGVPPQQQPFSNVNLQAASQAPLNQFAAQPTAQLQNQQTPSEVPPVVETPISTQATLMFSELRDSLIIMKDG